MQKNNFKFAVFTNRLSGDEFVKRLFMSNLFPEILITYDPFYFSGKNPIKNLIRTLKTKLKYQLKKHEFQKNYLPYFLAKEKGVLVMPSQLIRSAIVEQKLKSLDLDYIFVFTFGLLKENIFNIPKKGTINFHPAYLPKHRGASPAFWTILNGENTAGITFHFIDKSIDTGNIIEQFKIPLSGLEDSSILSDYLHKIGAKEFVKLIVKLKHGHLPVAKEQNNEEASYEKPASTQNKLISEEMSFDQINKLVNSSLAFGNALFKFKDQTYKVIECVELSENNNYQMPIVKDNCIYLKTGDNKYCCLIFKN